MSSGQIAIFLLSISVMLFMAKLLGELSNKLKQPAIIGEILAGILLGPTVFGAIFPGSFNILFPSNSELQIALQGITTLAVTMLLLVSGMEVDLGIVLKQRKTAVLTGIMGILLPFTTGFGFSYFFPNTMGIQDPNSVFVFALFMGTALSISALPVIAKTLMDLKIFNTSVGYIIISAAMFDDFTGWIIFSVILGMIGGSAHGFGFGETVTLTLLFVLFTLLIGRKIINRILPWIQTNLTFPGGVLNFILILGFLGAAFTEYIGVHAIFGAFMVGIAVGDSAHLKERTREMIHQFITNIFAPLFFVSIGLRINFITHFDLQIVLIVLVLAFIGKVVGCGLGAYWSGMNKNDSLAIGFGMNSRGSMEIILGLLALQFGLIQETVFVALVIMALFTSLASAPFMNYFLRINRKLSFDELLKPGQIIFTDASSKEEIITRLVNHVSGLYKLNASEVIEEVISREKIISTGVANYLALPHSKLKIENPIIAAALNSRGIDFEANDKIDARIIIILLSPSGDNQVQLKLLSEIARKFSNREKIEQLLTISDSAELHNQIMKL